MSERGVFPLIGQFGRLLRLPFLATAKLEDGVMHVRCVPSKKRRTLPKHLILTEGGHEPKPSLFGTRYLNPELRSEEGIMLGTT